jgi:hypothetical protein
VSVAVNGQAIYWTTGATAMEPSLVARADKANPAAISTFGMATNVLSRALVLDNVNAYWITTAAPPATGDTLWKIPAVFGTSGTPLYTSATGTFGGAAPGQGVVYFTSTSEGAPFNGPGIFSVALAGGAMQQVLPLSQGQTPREIVADATVLYFVVVTATSVANIYKLDLVAKVPTLLAPNEMNVSGLATDGTYVYWSTPGALRKVPTTGGTPTSFGAPNMGACAGMSVDATYLYCTDNATGQVLQFLLADTTQMFASTPFGVGGLRGVAADCSSVYVASGVQVERLARLP